MRQRVTTVLETSLYRRVKLEAARSGTQVAEVIEGALRAHLGAGGPEAQLGSVVAETWASLPCDRRLVQQVLSEEEGLLDA
jgi:hypothetical protein